MADKGFGQRLKTACDGHKDIPPYGQGRQVWLKDQMGVSHEAVSRWFSGKSRPRPNKMRELAELLNVDETWLSLGLSPEIPAKERRTQVTRASGAASVYMGLLQLSGGHCAVPSEGDPAADYVSFHCIREGTQTSYNIALAHDNGEGVLRVVLPQEYERCAVIAAIQTGPLQLDFIRMTHSLLEKHAVRRGGYYVVDFTPSEIGGIRVYSSGEDRWPLVTNLN